MLKIKVVLARAGIVQYYHCMTEEASATLRATQNLLFFGPFGSVPYLGYDWETFRRRSGDVF
jgi:hypothetical protein